MNIFYITRVARYLNYADRRVDTGNKFLEPTVMIWPYQGLRIRRPAYLQSRSRDHARLSIH